LPFLWQFQSLPVVYCRALIDTSVRLRSTSRKAEKQYWCLAGHAGGGSR
jgi:hypothetical protein